MAGVVLTDAVVTVATVDLSAYVQSVELSESFDELDTTNMGSGGRRERVAGLADATFTATFFQSWEALKVDATIAPLVGTVAAVTVKPTSGAISATNPEYQFNVLIKEWTSVSGAITKDITP